MLNSQEHSGDSALAQRSKRHDTCTHVAGRLCSGDSRIGAVERSVGSAVAAGLSLAHIRTQAGAKLWRAIADGDVDPFAGISIPPNYLSRPHEFRSDRVRWAEGGNIAQVRAHCSPPASDPAPRGPVLTFSEASRKRLLDLVNSVDRRKIDVTCLWFVTLTYPDAWPDDPREWKRHFRRFELRVRRAWGRLPVIWKLEAQQRGAPHFHLIVMVTREISKELQSFRHWCSHAWYECVASGDEKHLRAGTEVEPVRTWNGVSTYAAQYMGKVTGFVHPSLVRPDGEPKAIGRFWGVWNRAGWPIAVHEEHLPDELSRRVRRHVRRYIEHVRGKRRPRLRGACVPFKEFMSSADFVRLVRMEIDDMAGGAASWASWHLRRGRPEQISVYEIRQDFLMQCASEYVPSWISNDAAEAA